MRVLFQVCALLIVSVTHLQAEFRTFTNDFGDSVEAELVELKDKGSIIKMRLKDGRNINAKLSVFSQSDQKYIRNWWKEEVAARQVLNKQARLSVEVKVETKTRSQGHSSWYSASDDKTKVFYPQITIENNASQTFTGNEVRLVVFADDMRYKGQMQVVAVSDTKSDFKERAKIVLEPEGFSLRHYEYDSRYSNYEYEYGFKYSGYAVTVKNSEGKVIYKNATHPKFLNLKLFSQCKKGEIYDDDFERKIKATSSSSSSYR